MNRTVVTGRWLIASADQVFENYSAVIEGDRIIALGPTDEITRSFDVTAVLGDEDSIVMPGLVNAHHHCFGVPFANQAIEDDFLEYWLFSNQGARNISRQLTTTYSAIRMLKSGVTSVVDMCRAGTSAQDLQNIIDEKSSAYSAVGMRAAIAPGERWKNTLIHADGEDELFLASLPRGLRERVSQMMAKKRRVSPQDYLKKIEELADRFHSDRLIRIWFGPTAAHWTKDVTLRAIAETAERIDTRIQTHALESYFESFESSRSRGVSTIEHLMSSGLLNERTSLAHMVWASPDEFETLAQSGVHVSCNASSNLRLRSGIAPAAAMKSAGVNLAVGMDGTTLADDEDMFAEMRLLLNLNRPPVPNSPALCAKDVFQMATQGGSQLVGNSGCTGTLEVGAKADVVVVDLANIANHWVTKHVDPVSLLLSRATARDVKHVIVDGEIRLKDRTVCGVDEQAIYANVAAEMDRDRGRMFERAVASDIRPHLENWYCGWLNERSATKSSENPDGVSTRNEISGVG